MSRNCNICCFDFWRSSTLNAGRLSLPALCAGASKWCLNVAREWSGAREQWGGPIGGHEAVSDKLAFIAATLFFPIFTQITTNANPALEKAIESVKVEVVADPKGCGDLFNPVGTRVFTAPCDTARAYLSQQLR